MKKQQHLEFYKTCMQSKKLPAWGLCSCAIHNNFISKQLLDLLTPTEDDSEELALEELPLVYWGRGGYKYERWEFSPLRQNIVLFMACLNDEY